MCHDGGHGSPFAVQRSSNRAGGRDHGSDRGDANTPYGATAAEAGQSGHPASHNRRHHHHQPRMEPPSYP